MDTVTLLPQSIPRIWFAHEYGSREYDIPFPVMADRLEICHLIEGDVSREQGGRTVRIPRGSVVMNDYSCPVRYYGEGGYCLHRTVGLQMSFTRASAEDALVLPLVLCPGTAAALAGQTISPIIAEYAVSGPGSAKCVSLVFELFSLLDLKEPCGSRSGTGRLDSGAALADAALHYLAEHLDRPVRAEEIAASLNVSTGYLSTVFKRHTGQSLIAYFNRLKMERVCELMRVRGLSLKQAGAFVGLLDENYLSRLFRRHTGVSVREFRSRESE